jgi:arylsulfatase A-like enzyme
MIEVMDEGVGHIYQALKDADLDTNTFIFFFSDNGPDEPGSAGLLRGRKGEMWEGGHRVPAIAYWPGKIQAGSVSGLSCMSADLFPTMAAIAGAALPEGLTLDGINLLPFLIENQQPGSRPLFWSFRNQLAIRQDDFKLITDTSFTEFFLYNLSLDLGEEENIAAQHPDLVQELLELLKAWHENVTKDMEQRT